MQLVSKTFKYYVRFQCWYLSLSSFNLFFGFIQAGFAGSKNDENAFSRLQQKTSVFAVPKSAQQSFSIHEDPEPVIASAQSRTHSSSSVPEINPAITSLSSSALTNVFVANRARNEGKLQRIEFALCDPNFPHCQSTVFWHLNCFILPQGSFESSFDFLGYLKP